MKFSRSVFIVMFLFNYMNAGYWGKDRVSTLKEYKMMKICIDDKDTMFTSYVYARDNCACAIEKLPTKFIYNINRLKFSKSIAKELEKILSDNYEICEKLNK